MKKVTFLFLWFVTVSVAVLLFSSCTPICGCSPPPRESWYVHTYYKTSQGASLLNSSTANSFNPSDISAKTIMYVDATQTEVYYGDDKGGCRIQENGDTEGNSLILNLPVKYGTKKPIMTLVKLRSNLIDTITYSFQGRFIESDREIPDQLFYNRKLIWDFSSSTAGEYLPSTITIVK